MMMIRAIPPPTASTKKTSCSHSSCVKSLNSGFGHNALERTNAWMRPAPDGVARGGKSSGEFAPKERQYKGDVATAAERG
jgi:hypothetical protein